MTVDPEFTIGSHREGSTIELTVAPRSSVNGLERGPNAMLRARVTAPPVAGAANAAMLRLLAAALDVPRSRLVILGGESARRKRVLVQAMTAEMLAERLAAAVRQER